MKKLLKLKVNEEECELWTSEHKTLLEVLREDLWLTGTKHGCELGECGACTVMVDDTALYACSLLTQQVKGKSITTVEGLRAANGTPHPVQQAFIEELSPQCGFCTPGQVVSAAALLMANPNPTREEARQALSGNLCRCGAYDHYLNGVMRAAELIS